MMSQPRAKTRLLSFAALLLTVVLIAAPASADVPPGREFEHQVRELFFRGLRGDMEAFAGAMELCEKALAANPDDAEALVWRGSGTLFRAGQAFQGGDWQTGTTLWQEGLDEMERAVRLAPEDVAVRIPRGATLIGSSRAVPSPQQARQLLEVAVEDYEKVLEIQTPYFDKLSEHARGELLIGLIEAYARLGDEARADALVARLRREVADSEYSLAVDRALEADEGLARLAQRTCGGCHGGE